MFLRGFVGGSLFRARGGKSRLRKWARARAVVVSNDWRLAAGFVKFVTTGIIRIESISALRLIWSWSVAAAANVMLRTRTGGYNLHHRIVGQSQWPGRMCQLTGSWKGDSLRSSMDYSWQKMAAPQETRMKLDFGDLLTAEVGKVFWFPVRSSWSAPTPDSCHFNKSFPARHSCYKIFQAFSALFSGFLTFFRAHAASSYVELPTWQHRRTDATRQNF